MEKLRSNSISNWNNYCVITKCGGVCELKLKLPFLNLGLPEKYCLKNMEHYQKYISRGYFTRGYNIFSYEEFFLIFP